MKTRLSLLAALALAACNSAPKLEPLPAAPTIDSFTATPSTVTAGAMVHLAWQTHDATTISLAPVGGMPIDTQNKAIGGADVKVDDNSLFVLSAKNSRGVNVTAVASVGVEGAGTGGVFAALPSAVQAGATVTLAWSFPGAKSLAITEVGGAAVDLKGQGDTGSVQLVPSHSTQYQLTADGTVQTATVKVGPTLDLFSSSVGYGQPGDTVRFQWKTTQAQKVTLSSAARGALTTVTDAAMAADGTYDDVLPDLPLGAVVPYTVLVEGDGPSVTRSLTVYVGGAPKVQTFVAPKYAKSGGQLTLTWTTLNADVVELSTNNVVFWRSGTAAEAATGSLKLATPAAMTDYTLIAKSSRGGGSDSKTATVDPVGDVSVTTFTVSPSPVANGGDAATLTWAVPNARHLRITGSDGFTVATAHGTSAATGTATAYPNGPVTYTLTADNTLDAPVTATASGDATAPAAFGAPAGQAIFQGNPVDLSWTVGAGSKLQGFIDPNPTVVAGSTGFVDISATGEAVTFTSSDNDTSDRLTPADFETFLYGARVSSDIIVSTNGFFVFGTFASSRPTPAALPNTSVEKNFIAPYWADLELGTGHVYWEVRNEAPERTLIVQYDHVRVKGDPTSDLVFEAKVHQTGVVTFEYSKLQTAMAPMHTVGVEGGASTLGVTAGGEAAGGAVVLFGPRAAPIPFTFSAPATLGGFIGLSNGYLKVSYTPPQVVTTRDLAITEAMFNPAAPLAATGEWLEVTNFSQLPLDLGGWTLDFGATGSHTIAGALPLAPGATLVLGQTDADAGNDFVATQYQYGPAFAMDDAAGNVALRNVNFTVGASWPASDGGTTPPGSSLNFDPPVYLVAGETSTTALHSIACNSSLPFGVQAPQQLGSPGAIATCFGYQLQSIPVAFEDLSATGTAVFGATWDDSYLSVTLPTPFPYFGTPRSSATVSTNGWLGFGTYTSSSASNKTVPSSSSPKNVLGVFWDDLSNNSTFGASSQVFTQRQTDHQTIEWSHATHYTAGDDLNFEVKLFDDGHFEYHYATMTSGSSSSYANGNSATVWVENDGGTAALIIGNSKPVIQPNTAFRFTPR